MLGAIFGGSPSDKEILEEAMNSFSQFTFQKMYNDFKAEMDRIRQESEAEE